ncbi:Phage-related protein [Citrobacter freundii]|nr:Phage-related protein [Citrobacter freundii]
MLSIRRALKPIVWIGSSFDDLRSFPEDIRKTAGFQLHRLQAGLEAADWKPMPEIGRGVEEVRLRYESGAYRIIYIARYANAVYVLHCFNKRQNVLLSTINTLLKLDIERLCKKTGIRNEQYR